MDHADDAEREGNTVHHQIGEDPPLRGNSMVPPPVKETQAADDHGPMSMDIMDVDAPGADDSDAYAPSNTGLTLREVVGALEDTSPLPLILTSPAATALEGGLIAAQAGDMMIDDERLPSGAADSPQREPSSNNMQNGDSQTTGDAASDSADAIRHADTSESEANGSPRQLFGEQSPLFEHGQEMSIDEDDDDDDDGEEDEDDDILSDKASSFDAQSDSDAPHDESTSSQISDERAPLENAYAPFINPTDTCLADARERIHVALEQTRLLGASFTEQAYERYRCVMKPVPESLEEIIEPILTDPDQAVAALLEQGNVMKVEKDMEKRQAQQAGIGLEDVAYFGEGLHLVVLPEDNVDESDLDIAQYPHRGPTNPETGERVEEISASAAASTEQVFDRIRRIRAMRLGNDTGAGIPQDAAATHLKRNLSQDHQISNEPFPSGYAETLYLSSSPAQSMDSSAGDNPKHPRSSLQHLLTLAPDAEGVRPDGSFTAVRSALTARGVGMHEMRHDFRINPLHQRMLQPNYFPPTLSIKFLPPLLGPNQLRRLKAADARREGVEDRSGARESIRSVVEEIFAAAGGSGAESAGKFVNKDDGKIDDSRCGGVGEGYFGLRKFLHEERSASEMSLFRRMHSTKPQSHIPVQTSSTSNASTDLDWDKIDLGEEKLRPSTESGDVDPILAFSVMNAVGLVRNNSSNVKNRLPAPSLTTETGEAKALGLDSLSGLASVSDFFQTLSPSNDRETCPLPDTNGVMNDAKTDTSNNNGDINDEVCLIRGGGGQKDLSTIVPQIMRNEPDGNEENYVSTSTKALESINSAARVGASAQHPQLIASLRIIPSQTNVIGLEQEAAIAIIPDIHQNAVQATAAQVVTSPSEALYGTSLSSINPQNPCDFVASSPFQVHSNKTQSISSLPAFRAKQPMPTSTSQREKPSSLLDNTSCTATTKNIYILEPNGAEIESPAVASPPLATLDMTDTTMNGPPKRIVSHCEDFITAQSFAIPTPPEGLHQDIADLIALAKFHDAHSLSRTKSDEAETLLVKFLLSLSTAIPISKEFIADQLIRQLGSANYLSRLNGFVGCSSSATASRNVIVAIISVWLWVEHRDSCERAIVENEEEDPNYKWLVTLAVDMSLSALANYFDKLPSRNNEFQTNNEYLNQKVAAVTSESLAKEVVVDHHADASFSVLDDLIDLLDSLRTDALRAKTQERVLLASLASRNGNMTEAFSNAYVSSVVRAGVALGHENVCELGQDEACRASTLMPFDYFHDNMGIWEEPCRPTTGYRSLLGGDELTKQAHARSLIQKSMMRLQHRLGLKGGISDGGPYNAFVPPKSNSSTLPTPTGAPLLVRTPSGSLKRRGTNELLGAAGTGEQDTTFNPDHVVEPMLFNSKDVENFPYGEHQLGLIASGIISGEHKKRKLTHLTDDNQGGEAVSLALRYRSTQELEWDDVANMFLHGGNTRGVDINYEFSSNDQLGKRNIFAPFVRAFDRSNFRPDREADLEPEFDEDISDEAVLQRHRDALHEMKLKLDAALESRKQSSQQRGRKR